MKCSKLIGKLFKYNGSIQTIIKYGNNYKRIGCDNNKNRI